MTQACPIGSLGKFKFLTWIVTTLPLISQVRELTTKNCLNIPMSHHLLISIYKSLNERAMSVSYDMAEAVVLIYKKIAGTLQISNGLSNFF